MKVCQVVASINEETGGPAQSVSQLSISLASLGVSSELFTLDYRQHGKQVGAKNLVLHSFPAHLISRHFRGLHYGAMQELTRLTASTFSLIHNHGLWMFPNLFARRAARINRLPLVISPRGMLEEWSLGRSALKKALAWRLFERRNLECADMFHATSLSEMESIRKLGFRQPVAVIPNGVHLPIRRSLDEPSDNSASRDALETLYPELRGKRWLLFLSRIDPKKGVDQLIDTWSILAPENLDWHLIIAGPDLVGWREKLEAQIAHFKLGERVTFTGPLGGDLKSAAFRGAELFVLPTHSENFGMVIAESLSFGVPVVTTNKAPWEVIESLQCGWCREDSKEALEGSLREALCQSPEELSQKGLRGVELIRSEYTWAQVAEKMIQAYSWLLGEDAQPDFIYSGRK